MDILLQNLINAFGVSGHENDIRNVIKEELEDNNCNIREDKMGNLIVKIGKGNEKLMLCSHMDEVGVMATYIEDDGYVRIDKVGDTNIKEMLNSFVKFEKGIMGKIASSKEEPDIHDLFIDMGITKKENVLKKIREGDVASFTGISLESNGKIVSPSLDRIGCYILLKVIKNIKKLNKEVYFVFSTQKELGGRGARAAAYEIKPDYCIVIDVNKADDIAGGDGRIKLAHGPVLKIMDQDLIIDSEVKDKIEKAAKSSIIQLQYGVSNDSTDGGLIHKEVGGIRTGVLCVPCRYKHTSSEMIDVKDVEDLKTIIEEIILK